MFADRIRSATLGLLLATAAVLLPAGLTTGSPANASARSLSCSATFTVVAQWPTGYQAVLTVTNTGTMPLNRWFVVLTLPNGQQKTVSSNPSAPPLAPGASVQFGMLFTGTPFPPPIARCFPGV